MSGVFIMNRIWKTINFKAFASSIHDHMLYLWKVYIFLENVIYINVHVWH